MEVDRTTSSAFCPLVSFFYLLPNYRLQFKLQCMHCLRHSRALYFFNFIFFNSAQTISMPHVLVI